MRILTYRMEGLTREFRPVSGEGAQIPAPRDTSFDVRDDARLTRAGLTIGYRMMKKAPAAVGLSERGAEGHSLPATAGDVDWGIE
jgi:hypothetical protein